MRRGLTSRRRLARACAPRLRASIPQFAPGFFFHRFDWVRIGDGRAFATGYYEPEIEGSRVPLPGYVADPPNARRSRSLHPRRRQAAGAGGSIRERALHALFHAAPRSRTERSAAAGSNWPGPSDPVELFFLEIQGSGRVRFPDGSVMRIGYDSQNGRDYVAIGKLLRDRGHLAAGRRQHAGDQGLDPRQSRGRARR